MMAKIHHETARPSNTIADNSVKRVASPLETRLKATAVRSLLPAGNVIDSSLSFLSSPRGMGPARGRGLGGGGQGTFHPPCHILYCHIVLHPKGTSHNKKQCSRQLQCKVPCGVGNVVNSSLFIKFFLILLAFH